MGNTRPTIILLEQYFRIKSGYPAAYRTLAQHYGLLYWSFANVVNFAIHNKHDRDQDQVMIYVKTIEDGFHPSWYIHKLIAELYASVLMKYLTNDCILDDNIINATTIPLPKFNNTSKFYRSTCGEEFIPLLAKADFTKKNTNIKFSNQRWRRYVIEQKPPGWEYIYDGNNSNPSTISFPLSYSNIQPFKNVSCPLLVKIFYQRGPKQDGMGQIRLCGELVNNDESTLDTHWYRGIRIPRVFTVPITMTQLEVYNSVPEETQTLEITYVPQNNSTMQGIIHAIEIFLVVICNSKDAIYCNSNSNSSV